MGAAFLNAAAGISLPTIEQSAAYIDGWRKKLKDDKRLVVTAAGAAQKAADLILGTRFDEAAQVASGLATDIPTNASKTGPETQLDLF